ncbi:hypothetical protein [Alicyclobacillus sendaiensis]|uniref:hypothetical protein n=1 Tax=Alicyclobacillus sendaiensis TaxID=192387 RepID=UPI0026F4637D|nr:hypothetical protein [Alicyclobacillus sendaiensis]
MKIAVGIISLILMVIVGLQTLIVGVGGSITHSQGLQQGGAVGLLVAVLFLLGGAFAFGVPLVSAICLVLACIFGIMDGTTTPYHDQTVWGVIALILAVLAFFAWRSDRKKKRMASASSSSTAS